MFCPSCRDEFRAGFTRCANCDVDLVDSLEGVAPPAPDPAAMAPPPPLRLVDYCGFFSLDDAREARDRLRPERIRAEIVIREPQDADLSASPEEEYWLRVDAQRFAAVAAVLGFEGVSESSDDEACSECGAAVDAGAEACPSCGASFESG